MKHCENCCHCDYGWCWTHNHVAHDDDVACNEYDEYNEFYYIEEE